MNQTMYLNFDTIYKDPTYSLDPYSCSFQINPPLRNVSRIYLKSVEIPIGFCNVRTASSLNLFQFTMYGATFSVTITDKVYTSITTLLADLNSGIVTALLTNISAAGQTMIISTSSSDPSKLVITLGTATALTIVATNFSRYILGFLMSASISTGTTYTSTRNYLLNCDNYILLRFTNILSKNASNNSGILANYKIPLNCTSNTIWYQEDNSSFAQYIEIVDPSVPINRISVQVLDRFGTAIYSTSNLNLDWSMTLYFESQLNMIL
jgi:hypothetical protein